MSLRIEQLTRTHDRRSFDCGEEVLNDYLLRFAWQNEESRASRTFVAVNEEDAAPTPGCYTFATGKISFEKLLYLSLKDIEALDRTFPDTPLA